MLVEDYLNNTVVRLITIAQQQIIEGYYGRAERYLDTAKDVLEGRMTPTEAEKMWRLKPLPID